MKTMSTEAMQQIEGGGWRRLLDFGCGASLVAAVGGAIIIGSVAAAGTVATAGLGGPLLFAAGYSLMPGMCAAAAVT